MAYPAVTHDRSDLVAAYERGEQRGAQVERGRVFTDVERLIQRVIANTLSTELPHGAAGDPNAVVADQAARRAAPWRTVLDELASVTLTPQHARPWCPTLTSPPAGGVQTAEKTELPSGTIQVTGVDTLPQLVGLTCNISLQSWRAGEQAITALMVEAALKATALWVVGQLTAGVTASADLPSAVAAVEAAGWPPTHVIGPTSSLLALDAVRPALAMRLDLVGLTVVPAATGGVTLVLSQPGTWVGYSPAVVKAVEPGIGGMAVTAYCWAVANKGPGSVATIA